MERNNNRMVTLILKINWFGHGVSENQIQALSRTFRHRFKDFQGPTRALILHNTTLLDFRNNASAS